jgi:hypothetical protein
VTFHLNGFRHVGHDGSTEINVVERLFLRMCILKKSKEVLNLLVQSLNQCFEIYFNPLTLETLKLKLVLGHQLHESVLHEASLLIALAP